MLPYSDLLKSYISKSGLSLSEISEKLTEFGINADKSHLSKLQNGKLPPASDQMNRALASITGGNLEELLTAGVIEKAPKELRESWERLFQLKDLSQQYFKAQGQVQKASNDYEEVVSRLHSLQTELRDLETDPQYVMRIPVVKGIQFDEDIRSRIESWQVMVKEDELSEEELFFFRATDDDLAADRIKKGDLVLARMNYDFEEGVAVVNIDGGQATVRKIKKVNTDSCLVLADNLHNATILPNDRIRICGKVIRVIFNI